MTHWYITKLARDCIKGKWGNGEERFIRLEKAGFKYSAVQREVNRIEKERRGCQ